MRALRRAPVAFAGGRSGSRAGVRCMLTQTIAARPTHAALPHTSTPHAALPHTSTPHASTSHGARGLFVCLLVCLFACLLVCVLACLLVCFACLFVCLFVCSLRLHRTRFKSVERRVPRATLRRRSRNGEHPESTPESTPRVPTAHSIGRIIRDPAQPAGTGQVGVEPLLSGEWSRADRMVVGLIRQFSRLAVTARSYTYLRVALTVQ